MGAEPKPHKPLVAFTAAVLILITLVLFHHHKSQTSNAVDLEVSSHPTIGNPDAAIHIVVFEEPRCIDCMYYNNDIYPLIFKEYIETNQVKYTNIPVSFLRNSLNIGTALLCAYHENPREPNDEAYFAFLDYIYQDGRVVHNDNLTINDIVHLASQASPSINSKKLKKCIESKNYHQDILNNTAYATEVMKGNLGTPAIYVNGVLLENITYANLKKLITKAIGASHE